MFNYDPDNAPNPDDWLRLDWQERQQAIERYLGRTGGHGGSPQKQARLQAVVETQLAGGLAPVKAAFMRLRDNGLGRHEAIRALGSVLAASAPQVVRREALAATPDRNYLAQLETLTADTSFTRRGDRTRPAVSEGPAERASAEGTRPEGPRAEDL